MTRTLFAAGVLVMVLSSVAGASERVLPRPTFIRAHLNTGYLEGALRDARSILEERDLPRTVANQVNTVLQVHREDQAKVEIISDYAAVPLRALAEQDAANNPDDLVALHNLGYVLLYGIGGEADVARGMELIRRTEREGLLEHFLLVDPWIFDEPTPPLQSLAYGIMRGNNWQHRPALLAWLTAQIGANIFVRSR